MAIEYFSKGKTIDSYWYEGEGVEGYFDSEGNNTDITFLRMPCEARVTSTFNRVRKHPVTGRLRPHWGVDLGAPRGTPVYAAGDGVILPRNINAAATVTGLSSLMPAVINPCMPT